MFSYSNFGIDAGRIAAVWEFLSKVIGEEPISQNIGTALAGQTLKRE